MQCPHHAVALLKSQKYGIEIDYCPQCRGAWFDRGELDRVIEVYRSLYQKAQEEGPSRHEADESRRPAKRRRRDHPLKQIADLLEDIFD